MKKMTGRLKEKLGMVMEADPVVIEPRLEIPAADKASALKEAAEGGFAAITALYADRNKSVELAQSLHRHNVYLQNVNIELRGRLQHANLERDYYMKMNARVGAWVIQAHDLLARIAGEVGHVTELVEHMEPAAPVSNNPDVPELDTVGLPVEVKPNGEIPAIDIEQIQDIIGRLGDQENGSGSASPGK